MDAAATIGSLRRAALGVERAWSVLQGDRLTLLQGLVLLDIAREPGIRPHLLRERYGYPKRQNRPIQQVLLRLARAGLVRTERRDHSSWLTPTAEGRRSAAACERSLGELATLYWGDLSPDQVAAARILLVAIVERSP